MDNNAVVSGLCYPLFWSVPTKSPSAVPKRIHHRRDSKGESVARISMSERCCRAENAHSWTTPTLPAENCNGCSEGTPPLFRVATLITNSTQTVAALSGIIIVTRIGLPAWEPALVPLKLTPINHHIRVLYTHYCREPKYVDVVCLIALILTQEVPDAENIFVWYFNISGGHIEPGREDARFFYPQNGGLFSNCVGIRRRY